MIWQVTSRPEADQDIENAASWYQNQQPGLGLRFLDEILATQDRLAQQPMMYPVLHERIRRIITNKFPFAIYYVVGERIVVIVAVLHMRRNPKIWKKRI